MTEHKKLIIFLSQYDFSASKISKILDFLDDQSIAGFKKAKFSEKMITAEQKDKMMESAHAQLVETYSNNLLDRGIKIVVRGEEDFPEKLFPLDDCPQILYYMGDLSLANKPSISVVGTRKPSSYGRMITERFVTDLASSGIVIISGLAYGVDSIAHRKCLDVGGKTIAVLGGGFDHIYPAEHMALAKEIAEKGLLISEFRPKLTAGKYNFPLRNRIIAGLSDGVLITEANMKSGTIHTRDFALEYGKNLYAVPGNIDSPLSKLTNEIIKTCQGSCVVSSEDILIDFEGVVEKGEQMQFKDIEGLDENEKIVINALKNGMISIDELSKFAGIDAKILNSCLTTLEIRGLINRLHGGFVSLC